MKKISKEAEQHSDYLNLMQRLFELVAENDDVLQEIKNIYKEGVNNNA